MGNLDNDQIDQVKELINASYKFDYKSIKNLTDISNKLINGGVTVPGDLTITGQLKTSGDISNNSFSLSGLNDQINKLKSDITNIIRLEVKGIIVAWAGTIAPSGWTLCDGSNGSPDLRNKFVLGWGKRRITDQGGEENVTLGVHQMPSHSHDGKTNESGNHKHGSDAINHYHDAPTVNAYIDYNETDIYWTPGYFFTDKQGNHNHDFKTDIICHHFIL